MVDTLFSDWYKKNGTTNMLLGKIFYGGVAERDRQNKETVERIIKLIGFHNGYELEQMLPKVREMLSPQSYPFDNYSDEQPVASFGTFDFDAFDKANEESK